MTESTPAALEATQFDATFTIAINALRSISVPIMVQGECVGSVGVSGVQSHEDEQVAKAGIDALGI